VRTLPARLLLGVAVCACASTAPAPIMRTRITNVDSFSPETGTAALKAFVPDVPAFETGGECALHKLTPAAKSTVATAYFPNRTESQMNVSITFDSAGHVARYSEVRGMTGLRGIPPGTSEAQRDTLLRAALAKTRTTSISFNYDIEQAVVRNHGGGVPDNAVLATPREMESLAILGPVKDRLVRIRRLCGV
jgi:hypothetical protein